MYRTMWPGWNVPWSYRLNDRAAPQRLNDYNTLAFDCDGVLLDSNPIKTNAFYQASLPYGTSAARMLQEYHVQNGGVSRYRKFQWFLTEVVGQHEPDPNQFQDLLDRYAAYVVDRMLKCELVPRLEQLRNQTRDTRWLVISGSDEEELRWIFQQRGLVELFDGGIHGSPRTKIEHLEACAKQWANFSPGLFFGDAEADYQAAKHAGFDFCFVSQWSELPQPPRQSCYVIDRLDVLVHGQQEP